jgi:hypothetical protein
MSASTDPKGEEPLIPLDEIERVEATGKAVLSGFGAIKDRLEVERHARLDRGLDSLEAIGKGVQREGALAETQAQELIGEVESAVGLFFEAVFEPEKFKEKHGLGNGGSGG